jgi:hypothetical protein
MKPVNYLILILYIPTLTFGQFSDSIYTPATINHRTIESLNLPDTVIKQSPTNSERTDGGLGINNDSLTKDPTKAKSVNVANMAAGEEKKAKVTGSEIKLPAMKGSASAGTNMFILSIDGKDFISHIDLTSLGVKTFDNAEVDKVVYTPGEGNVHYIMNDKWNGVLVVFEPSRDAETKTLTKYIKILTNDGSKINPSSNVSDDAGLFGVGSSLGIVMRNQYGSGYIPLDFGVKKYGLITLKIEGYDFEMQQKIIIASVPESEKKIKVGTETGNTNFMQNFRK